MTPTVPGDLRVAVYSPHTVELFWNASVDNGWVIGYDIYRDSVRVAEQLDALSYYDDTLQADTAYTYQVMAIDNEFYQSEPATVSVETPAPAWQSTINIDNYVAILELVFSAYTGNAYFADVAKLPRWPGTDYDGVPGLRPADWTPSLLNWRSELVCSNGGLATLSSEEAAGFGYSAWLDFELDNCQVDTNLLNGQLKRRFGFTHGGQGNFVTSSGLMLTHQSGEVRFSGEIWEGQGSFGANRTAIDSSYFSSEFPVAMNIEHANTSFTNGLEVGLYGTMTLSASLTNGNAVETVAALSSPRSLYGRPADYDGSYALGTITLHADDGSSLLLTADNGDPRTVSVEIRLQDRVIETATQPWSLWSDALKFEHVIHELWPEGTYPDSGRLIR